MHVTITTTRGSLDQPPEIATLAGEEMLPWLREIDGFHGMLVLFDESKARTLVVTFWESREIADRHLVARASFRERITSTVDVRVEDVSDYRVMFADLGSWPADTPG